MMRWQVSKAGRPPAALPPETFRPTGQIGLEQFATAGEDLDSGAGPEPPEAPRPITMARDLLSLEELGPPDVPGATITVDDRELRSAVIARLRSLGNDVAIERLGAGDFRIGERILVERKTVRDFVDSLVDGRLLEQASRLVGSAPRSMILIEGEGLFHNPRVHPHALMGALTTLTLDFGIPIVTTKDGAETARFLTVAARREESMLDGLGNTARERLASSRTVPWGDPLAQAAMGAKDLREHEGEGGTAARALLEAIPGIDGAMASGLLEHFGTLAALAWADERELRDVQGLSETQVRELLNTIRGGED